MPHIVKPVARKIEQDKGEQKLEKPRKALYWEQTLFRRDLVKNCAEQENLETEERQSIADILNGR